MQDHIRWNLAFVIPIYSQFAEGCCEKHPKTENAFLSLLREEKVKYGAILTNLGWHLTSHIFP